MFNELKNPTISRANVMIISTTACVMVIYIAVAICGYFTYGDNVSSNILNDYPTTSIPATVARLGMSTGPVASRPRFVNQCPCHELVLKGDANMLKKQLAGLYLSHFRPSYAVALILLRPPIPRAGIGISVSVSYPLYAHPARQALMHGINLILEITGKDEMTEIGHSFQRLSYWIITVALLGMHGDWPCVKAVA